MTDDTQPEMYWPPLDIQGQGTPAVLAWFRELDPEKQALPQVKAITDRLEANIGMPEQRVVPRQPQGMLDQLAIELVRERIFCSALMSDLSLIGNVFMPVGLGALAHVDAITLGTIYEYMDKAGPRGINGYPMFMSAQLLHVQDWDYVQDEALRRQALLHAPNETKH